MSKDGNVVWKRYQADQNPAEYSPVRVVVSNYGWSAIEMGWDQLIFVDADGRNRARINDIKTLLTDKDRREFTIWSTAGVIWSPSSLWHFVDFNGHPSVRDPALVGISSDSSIPQTASESITRGQ